MVNEEPFFAICQQVVLRFCFCQSGVQEEARVSFKKKPNPRYVVYHDAKDDIVKKQLEVCSTVLPRATPANAALGRSLCL